jgi:hypothetical protein
MKEARTMLTEGGETITFATQATLRESKRVDWVPKEDITTYELAMAMPALFALAHLRSYYPEDYIAGLPENVRRHFRISDQ